MIDQSVPDISAMTDAQRFELAKGYADQLRNRLAINLQVKEFTSKSKVPWKAVTFGEVLLHRMSDLTEIALELYERDCRMSAFIQTRAVVETTAMFFWLHKKCQDFIKAPDPGTLNEFLDKGLLGSRDGQTAVSAHSILTAVDHADKEYESLRKMYDTLCEFTHPNYGGVLGAYSKIDQDQRVIHFGRDPERLPLAWGLGPLIGCMGIFRHHYDELAAVVKALNEHFEAEPDTIS